MFARIAIVGQQREPAAACSDCAFEKRLRPRSERTSDTPDSNMESCVASNCETEQPPADFDVGKFDERQPEDW
jgi:hypothetical protein